MAKTTRKRIPTQQDTTLRNLRVTRRDVADLQTRVTWLEQALVTIRQVVDLHWHGETSTRDVPGVREAQMRSVGSDQLLGMMSQRGGPCRSLLQRKRSWSTALLRAHGR